jgi:hypothetical protein
MSTLIGKGDVHFFDCVFLSFFSALPIDMVINLLE